MKRISIEKNWGPHQEQIRLGANVEFWKMITKRRREKTLGRAQLNRKLSSSERVGK